MDRAIEYIKLAISEHEKECLCTEEEEAIGLLKQNSLLACEKAFEAGRFVTLLELLDTLENFNK